MFAHLFQVQPVDAVLLAAVKSRNDAYESVVSASPLLHLTHPNSQPLRRPLTITLPCPPNSEKKEEGRRNESKAHQVGAPSDPLIPSGKVRWVKSVGTVNRLCHFLVLLLSWFLFCVSIRVLGAYVRSNETSNELLIVLGSRDKQWTVLDKIVIRNQKNGLVSFDLIENFDRLVKRYPSYFHLFNLLIWAAWWHIGSIRSLFFCCCFVCMEFTCSPDGGVGSAQLPQLPKISGYRQSLGEWMDVLLFWIKEKLNLDVSWKVYAKKTLIVWSETVNFPYSRMAGSVLSIQ